MGWTNRVLIVDDDEGMRFFLKETLSKEGLGVEEAPDAETALAKLESSSFDLVMMDVKLPGMNGMEATLRIKENDPDAMVIIMTAFSTREFAREAIKNGAYDYFTKPFSLDEMSIVVRRALEKRHLQMELRNLQEKLRDKNRFGNLVGMSNSMQSLYEMIERVASSDATVLIYGESGTGKERVAEAIHERSLRKDKSFIKINCAAIPETLLESELFGYEEGAFTGAAMRKPGKFELADGGTIFLDEVGDMSPALQAKLLRVLQGSEFERVGGIKPIKVDIRMITATNKILADEVKEKRFRLDLFYRLSVFTINIPPLRERKEDIPLLAEYFMRKSSAKQKKPIESISKDAIASLMDYHWPGNVRQLENCIERTIVLTDGNTITAKSLPPYLQEAEYLFKDNLSDEGFSLNIHLEDVERKLIIKALERTGGSQVKAAKLLDISERSLWHRVKKLNVDMKALTLTPTIDGNLLDKHSSN